jgi:arabinogalactan oligomer/maltooligosaccharide transport system permease protein
MSTRDEAADFRTNLRAEELAIEGRAAVEAPAPKRSFADTWWRHLVALLAVAFAIFPAVYVVSAAFNGDQSISGASLIPRDVTLDNFRDLFNPPSDWTETNYPRWFLNSMLVALFTSFFTVMLGALAAYAFSRFRFRGRRMGLLFLLLIQMFPQLLMLVALYLIVLRTGEVFPALGLNHLLALMFVYLGGVLGVNVWLMKGFFDSIPSELDESARVDGATAGQIFWGVILPLAAPVLAVVGLFAFVGTFNEFAIASVLLELNDERTLPVGLRLFIADQYGQRWGPFAAGVLIAAVPAVLLFAYLQRFIVSGLTQGSVKG